MRSPTRIMEQARSRVIPALAFYIHKVVTEDVLEDIIEDVSEVINGDVEFETMANRLAKWLGREVTQKELFPMALAILAWQEDSDIPDKNKSVSCQVFIDRVIHEKKSCTVLMYVLDGPFAGERLRWQGPLRRAYDMATLAGFPKYKGPDVRELSGMFHMITLKNSKIVDVLEVPRIKALNNKIRSKRRKCEFYDRYPCDKCPRGRDRCRYAARPITMVKTTEGKWKERTKI